MGWSIGWDSTWKRDIGYGVPAICDHPECSEKIDRGLAYVCGGNPHGGDHGCGLFFCDSHLLLGGPAQQCHRCVDEQHPFDPKPETREWLQWKLSDESWAQWRVGHVEEVARMQAAIGEVA